MDEVVDRPWHVGVIGGSGHLTSGVEGEVKIIAPRQGGMLRRQQDTMAT